MLTKIQSLYGKPDTFEGLTLKLINCVPKGVNSVHFVADSYLHNSIKVGECKICAENRIVLIKLMKSKVPPDFQSFLKNDDNKTRII